MGGEDGGKGRRVERTRYLAMLWEVRVVSMDVDVDLKGRAG